MGGYVHLIYFQDYKNAILPSHKEFYCNELKQVADGSRFDDWCGFISHILAIYIETEIYVKNPLRSPPQGAAQCSRTTGST